MGRPKTDPAAPAAAKKKRKRPEKLPKPKDGLPVGHPGRGRPREYDKDAYPIRAKKLALLGMTDEQIAFQFGIAYDTLRDWAAKHKEFSSALADGRENADAEVAASLYERATGRAKRAAVKVSFDKDGNPLYAPYVETALPDVGAAKFWLSVRQPKWIERKDVGVSITLEQQIAELSPEDRLQRLMALRQSAALIIDGEADEVEE